MFEGSDLPKELRYLDFVFNKMESGHLHLDFLIKYTKHMHYANYKQSKPSRIGSKYRIFKGE